MTKAPIKADVAQRLKEARLRIYPRAVDAAEALHMKAVTLRAHENAQNGISVYDLERYARRYGVNVQWLMTGEGEQTPEARIHLEQGELVPVREIIVVEQWLPRIQMPEGDPRTTGRGAGVWEVAPFTDPRFPTDMVDAFRVQGGSPLGHYVDGSVVFTLYPGFLGYGEGDHVLVVRERGDFLRLSICRVQQEEGGRLTFVPVTDPGGSPIPTEIEGEEPPRVTAVVIGSITRRPVRGLGLSEIQRNATQSLERGREARRTIAEVTELARAIVAGEKAVPADIFDTVEQAQKWVSAMDRIPTA